MQQARAAITLDAIVRDFGDIRAVDGLSLDVPHPRAPAYRSHRLPLADPVDLGMADHEQLAAEMPVYDALYAWCKRQVAAG